MNLPWEGEAARAVRAAEALLSAPVAELWPALAFAAEPDSVARFDALLASLLASSAEPSASAAEAAPPPFAWPDDFHAADASSAARSPAAPQSAARFGTSFHRASARIGAAPEPITRGRSSSRSPRWLYPRPFTAAGEPTFGDAPARTSSPAAGAGASPASTQRDDAFAWTSPRRDPLREKDLPFAAGQAGKATDGSPVDGSGANRSPSPVASLPPTDIAPTAGVPAFPAPAPFTTRLAASTSELSALLQAQVTPPDANAPPAAFPVWARDAAPDADAPPPAFSAWAGDAAPGAYAPPAAFPMWAGDAAPGLSPVPAPPPLAAHARPVPPAAAMPSPHPAGADPVAAFDARPAADTGEAAVAEEILVDRILDRLQERMREESIRRFGLTGGLI
jgi:hypothetical protein